MAIEECCIGWPYCASLPQCHRCCQHLCHCCSGGRCCREVCSGLLIHIHCCCYCKATAEKNVLPCKHAGHWLCWRSSSKPWSLSQCQWGMTIILNTVVVVPLSLLWSSSSPQHGCPAVIVIVIFVSRDCGCPCIASCRLWWPCCNKTEVILARAKEDNKTVC